MSKKNIVFITIVILAVISEVLDYCSTINILPNIKNDVLFVETNKWIQKFDNGKLGFAIIVSGYFVLNVSMFVYSNYFFEIHYTEKNRTSLRRIIFYYFTSGFHKKWYWQTIKSGFNIAGFYYIRHSIAIKLFWSVNNYLLGVIHNNSVTTKTGMGFIVDLSPEIDWNTGVYKLAKNYHELTLSLPNGSESIAFIVSCIISVFILYFFFRKYFISSLNWHKFT